MSANITVTILNQSQWSANPDLEVPLKFKRSHLHPGFLYRIDGLEASEQYMVHLEIAQVDSFKYTMQDGVYKPRCDSGCPIPPAQIARVPKYKDVAFAYGSDLGTVDFSTLFFIKKKEKTPLDNVEEEEEYEEGTIALDTVYKFEPCLVVVKKDGVPQRFPQPIQRFVTVSSRKRQFVDVDASVGQPPARRSRARAARTGRVPPVVPAIAPVIPARVPVTLAYPAMPVATVQSTLPPTIHYPMPCYPPVQYYNLRQYAQHHPCQYQAYPAHYQYPVSYDNYYAYPAPLAYQPSAQFVHSSYQQVTPPIQYPPAILPIDPLPTAPIQSAPVPSPPATLPATPSPPVTSSSSSGTTPEPEISLPSEEEVGNDDALCDQIFDFNLFLGRDDFFEEMDKLDKTSSN